MRIALCQLNPTVGDIDGNAERVVEFAVRAHEAGADLAVFPEQVISGYPAEDLWLKPHFVARCADALARIAPRLPLPCLVGFTEPGVPAEDSLADDPPLAWNAAAYVVRGRHVGTYRKQLLPNYGVFDEHRWFASDDEPLVVEVPCADGVGRRVGVTICEDAWVAGGPVEQVARLGVDAVVNLSASPWRMGRSIDRAGVVRARARENATWLLLCNQVGGQDELVFDGHSLVAAPDGTLVAEGARFAEDLVLVDVDAARPDHPADRRGQSDDLRDDRGVSADTDAAEVWGGLCLGLADYVRKNGFRSIILGLSGGIDSALVLALAVDALGADAVHAVTMPSRFSADATKGDAHAQAVRLGVDILELPIEPLVTAFDDALAAPFAGTERDVTEENLQARIRGTLLMALSNKHGHLVLATGNKSEYSVGYATLYGDMNGGFAPLKDVPKTLVFRLARWRNELAAAAAQAPVVPPSVIERPPSAELRPGQRDSDSLPDYDTLDAVLELLVDDDRGVEEAIAAGFDAELVDRVQRMLDRAEYKRRQAPPGPRISAKAFGRDRRVPITNRFDGRLPAH